MAGVKEKSERHMARHDTHTHRTQRSQHRVQIIQQRLRHRLMCAVQRARDKIETRKEEIELCARARMQRKGRNENSDNA